MVGVARNNRQKLPLTLKNFLIRKPKSSSLKSAQNETIQKERQRLSQFRPQEFGRLPPKQQNRISRLSLKSNGRSQNANNSNKQKQITPVLVKTFGKFTLEDIQRLKRKAAQALYHEALVPKEFFTWFDQIVGNFKNIPRRLHVRYGDQGRHFMLTVREWLSWLFSDKALNRNNTEKLRVLSHHNISDKLSIGPFNELRVGIALQSLKMAGLIKDFILFEKFSSSDHLGIDALAIIHEDKAGHSLSVPLQVKSHAGDPKFNYYSEAIYPLNSSQYEYIFDGSKSPNPKKLSNLKVERYIPLIRCSGQSINNLKEHIISLIKEAFDQDRFLQFFGKIQNKSFLHKLKLLIEQGFIVVQSKK